MAWFMHIAQIDLLLVRTSQFVVGNALAPRNARASAKTTTGVIALIFNGVSQTDKRQLLKAS
jgi:hypothetical protein